MIPNNQADTDTRFHRFVQAMKFVYASTFFASARSYIRAIGQDVDSEKMAVISPGGCRDAVEREVLPDDLGSSPLVQLLPDG